MKRSGTIGPVLLALLSVVILAGFLLPGPAGQAALVAGCGLFPAALYLAAPGPGRRISYFPWVLGLVLSVGLAGLFLYSAAGRGGDGLIWMIVSLWLLPLVLVSAFHAVFQQDDRPLHRIEELRRRFGDGEDER